MTTKDVADDDGPNAGTHAPPPTPTPGFNPSTSLLDTNDDKTTFHKVLLRVDAVRPAADPSPYPIKAFLREFLQHLQQVDSNNNILPIDEATNGIPLTKETDIPTGDDINKYVTAITNTNAAPNKRDTMTLRFHIRINATKPLWQLKQNTSLYAWLNSQRIYLRTHGFTTTYDVAAAGFLGKMSPTMHWRETINKIIQEAAKTKALGTEIKLIPRTIPYGKGDEKTATTAVEIQTDRSKVGLVREFMIELFETQRHLIPQPVFFVPSPANGTMTHDLYYSLLRVHHSYTHDLRSFAITNVRDLQATLTIPTDDQGNTKQLSFIEGLTMAEKADGTKLFVSIEPTTRTEKDGRYLVITTKDCLAEAQAWFDSSVEQIASGTPDNMVRITRDASSTVSRTNRIATSIRFQSYTATLQAMLPQTITTTTPPPNAWKRPPPVHLNLTDDTFPALESTKKPKTSETVATDLTSMDETPPFTTVDLDDIDAKREALRSEMHTELEKMRQEMAKTRQEMREEFMLQVGQMELRLEKNMKPMISDFNERVRSLTLHIQTVADSVTTHSEVNDAKFDRIMAAIESLGKRSLPTPDGTPLRNLEKRIKGKTEATNDPMPIDYPTYEADGSLPSNPTASRAITPTTGKHAPAGANK
jgi:hypothetical protein